MKTDDLIDMLSSDIDAVNPRRLERNFLLVVTAAFVLVLVGNTFALSFDWSGRFDNFRFLALKVAFSLSVLGLATYFLIKHLRPGGERRTVLWPTALPFIALVAFAMMELSLAPLARWHSLMIGDHWLECIVFILLAALIPSAIIIAAARMAAPTDPVKTGALAGIAAGAMGALAYALHCTDDSISFIAVWYAAAIILCGFVGAIVGPRVLRW